MDKYTQNENFTKIENSERFVNLSNSFAISKQQQLIACFRPFLGEINVHKFDGTLVQVIENIYEEKISICFAPQLLIVYCGANGCLDLYEDKSAATTTTAESPPPAEYMSHEQRVNNHFDLMGKITKPRLICRQHYHYMCCHKKLMFFNNRLFVIFSENNYIGLIDC